MSLNGWRVKSRDDIIFELSHKVGMNRRGWERLVFPKETGNKLILLWSRLVIANPYDSKWFNVHRRRLFRMDPRSICNKKSR